MESRRMSKSRSWIKEHHSVLVAILVLFCCVAVAGAQPNFNKIFVIGDSYQDNGNRDPTNNTRTVIGNVNQSWKTPYGRTTGSPQGRFTDGAKCLSDFLADSLTLNPRPFGVLNNNSHPSNVNNGVNFAVGGAGVFDNEGFTKTGDQIKQLRAVLRSGVGGPYDSVALRKSVVFYGISGNDYAAFLRRNANVPVLELIGKALVFVQTVVNQATKDVQELYNLGFRSFVIGKLAPVGCNPALAYNATTDSFACNELFNVLATSHNAILSLSLTLSLPVGAKFIYLNNQAAFGTVTYNLTNPGRLVPCCSGLKKGRLCGDVDANNNPDYTICDPRDQGNFFFWDEFHPTTDGWSYIFNLFLNDPFNAYTDGKSLKRFLGV